MKRFLLLCAVLLASACSSTAPDAVVVGQEPAQGAFDINRVEGVVYAQTDGAVEIYNLDFDRPASFTPARAPEAQPIGLNVLRPSPSVEVFPLDADMAESFKPARKPVLLPPIVEETVIEAPPTPLAAAPPPLPQAPAVIPLDPIEGIKTVYFDHGSAALDIADLDVVDDVARHFDPSLGVGLDVIGHASVDSQIRDPVHRKISNLEQSMERAHAVAAALMRRGVPSEAIRVTAWGEARPPPQTASDPAILARRVEIVMQGG